MINHFVKYCTKSIFHNKIKVYFAQDWSHVYNGIFRFEDSTLGEEVLAIREQALNFAKSKLSPNSL
jgi:hypothetical protein